MSGLARFDERAQARYPVDLTVDATPPTGSGGSALTHDGAEQLRSPRMIGRYLVLGLLGRGGMSVVYSGFDDQLQRRVAIKQVNRRNEHEVARQRSLREAQALAQLTHPNVVTVHDAFEVDAQLCIVMELVAGQTLREWLTQEPTQAKRLEVLIQAGRGIAAAHEAGLIHRDLKPDNIMLGDDGRVRVMDFGLSRAVEGPEADLGLDVASLGANNLLFGSLTHTGALMGTPGYVAPEHYLGHNTDARSDLFGFCVLAFEALHGRRPFADREATLAGRVVVPETSAVPAWLDAVIRRGIAVEPDARWPNMHALLDALERDPIVRRRRRWQRLALVVGVGVLVTGLIWAAASLREARAHARKESAAATRLQAVEATIIKAEAEGDVAAAEAAFRTFASDPEHIGTRALSRAWLGRGERQQADPELAKLAYAEAYVSATQPEDEREALRHLTAIFHEQWDGVGLGNGIELLRSRPSPWSMQEQESLAELGFRAALWRRDFPGALAELDRIDHSQVGWRPLLDHLSRARGLGILADHVSLLPSTGAARIVVHDADKHELVLLDAGLAEVGRRRVDSLVALLPELPWAIRQTEDGTELLDVLEGKILGRGASTLHGYAAFDATGDRMPELFFGRIWPSYGFARWDALGRADMHERSAHAQTDASDSSFEASAVGDLDGDGVDELVVAFGPWHRFDVRVFRPDAHGELDLVTQRLLGRVGGLAIVAHGQRRLLAVFVDNSCPAPELFPTPPYTGGSPGIHLFELVGGELVEVEVHELPNSDGFGRFIAHGIVVSDLDGDGRDDLAAALGRGGEKWLTILRQTELGFESLQLAQVRLFGRMQLDDDAPLELLVQRWPERELVALGLGDEPTPPSMPMLVDRPPPPTVLDDPLLIERWQRANDLTTLQLIDSAAVSLRDTAALTADAPSKSVLLDRAAELFASVWRSFDVVAIDPQIHVDPNIRARAQARHARALARLGRYEEAQAEAEALLESPAATTEQLALAQDLVGELSALLARAPIELRFDVPLTPEWLLHTPGALRRDPTRGVLELTVPATQPRVAELPVEWSGGPITLEFELELRRLEYGACIEIALVDADDEAWLGAGFCGQGGGGALQSNKLYTAASPWHEVRTREVSSALDHGPVKLRVAYFPGSRRAELMILDGNDPREPELVKRIYDLPAVRPTRPGPQRMIIGAFGSTDPSLAMADIHRIVIGGARLGAATADELARARPVLLLAEHEPRAALAALALVDPPSARSDSLRLLALAELGDLEGLAEIIPTLLVRLDDPSWRDDPTWLGDLALALRLHPLAAASLREAAGPALLPVLASIWAHTLPHRNDRRLRAEILVGLQNIEDLAPQTDAEREALRGLLQARAVLWQRSGESERARRDLDAAAQLRP